LRVRPWPNSEGGIACQVSTAPRMAALLGRAGSVELSMAAIVTGPP
jgi:hypothetical protein